MSPTQQLIDFVKQASPFLWGVAYRQVWVEIVAHGIGALLLLPVAVYCLRRGYLDEWDNPGWPIGGCVTAMLGIGCLIAAALALANPGYAAVENLIHLVPR